MKELFYFGSLMAAHEKMPLAEDEDYFAYCSRGFIFFDYIGIEDSPTPEIKAQRVGWKFHVSIDDSIATDGTQPNLALGWNIVMGILYDNHIYRAKVVKGGIEMAREPISDSTDVGVHMHPNRGKQVTICAFFNPAQDWV